MALQALTHGQKVARPRNSLGFTSALIETYTLPPKRPRQRALTGDEPTRRLYLHRCGCRFVVDGGGPYCLAGCGRNSQAGGATG